MAEEILRTFVLRCKEGRLQKEEAVALLNPALIHVQVQWEYEGSGFASLYMYSLGLMLVNVVRCHQHELPHWKSIVTALVGTGIDVNELSGNGSRYTLLHCCAKEGDVDFARVLVHDLGCKSNIRDSGGWTPLHCAAEDNSTSNMLEILLTAPDLDLTTGDFNGRTALDLANYYNADVCAGLLQAAELKEKEAQSARDDTEDRQKLNAAIADAMRRGGIAKVLFLHIAILGAARTGKSSLLKSLLDEPFDEAELSTIGMNIRSALSRIDRDGKWILLDDMLKALERLFVTTLIKEQSSPHSAASASPAAKPRPPPPPPPASVASVPDHDAETSSAALTVQEEPVAKSISEVLQSILSKDISAHIKSAALEGDFAVISAWDLGGQQVYQCSQPLFIAENTTYIVVYDASLDLEAKLVNPDVLHKKNRVIHRAMLNSANTHLEQLLTFFDVLQMRSTGNSPQEQLRKRAVVVGCKNDERIRLRRDDPRGIIRRKIKNSPYQDVVSPHLYLVDNRKSGGSRKDKKRDEDIQELRSMLNERCRNDVQKIPVFWLHFTIAITMVKRSSNMPWISLKDATHMALSLESISHKSQMESLLKYHHDAGHVAYFNTDKLNDIIILDPQFVLDCVSAMLHVSFESDNAPGYIDQKLYSEGFVTEVVAMFALEQQFDSVDMEEGERRKEKEKMREKWREVKKTGKVTGVFNILEELYVIAILPADTSASSGSPMFILPAAVERENVAALEEAEPACLSPHMYIRLVGVEHFPVFIYWQCVVECLLKARRHGVDIKETCLSLQEAQLPWKKGKCWLRLRYGNLGLRLQMERPATVAPWPETSTVGEEAAASVKQGLKDIVRKRKLSVKLEDSLPCPCGNQQGVQCLLHGLESCAARKCDHMLKNVSRQEMPQCTRRKCPPMRIERNAAWFWLGLAQDGELKLGDINDPPAAAQGSQEECEDSVLVTGKKAITDVRDTRQLVDAIGDFLDKPQLQAFGRWAVCELNKAATSGTEHNILGRYLRSHPGALAECNDWFELLVIFEWMRSKRCGITINKVYDGLTSEKVASGFRTEIRKALSDESLYK